MPRTPITTSYTPIIEPTTSYWARTDTIFLMTQVLDFLMTQDNNYLVLQSSYSDYTPYNTIPVILTSYT